MDLLNDIDEVSPTLYSKVLVLIYSVFLTPVGGAVLIAINLIMVGKVMNIIWLVITLIVLGLAHLGLLAYYGLSAWTFFLPLVLGAILFAFPVWNMLLRRIRTYKKRGFWVPIIVLLLIWIPLMLLNFIEWKG